jgi:hypothetical protein
MNFFGGAPGAAEVFSAKGEAGIFRQPGGEALPAIRTVASTELLVTTPATTRLDRP